jgi:hypothetical protein
MSIRLYVREPEATGCTILCLKNEIWPAVSGILSDNMWQFDDDLQPYIKEVLTAMNCCETFEQCGLVTNDDLNEALQALLDLVTSGSELDKYPVLPPEGQPDQWPETPSESQQFCDMSNAIFNAILLTYDNIYQGEMFDDALAFLNIFSQLLIGTVSALLDLFAEILGSGAYALVDDIAEANRDDVVCTSIAMFEAEATLEDVRDYQIETFKDWTPIPLDLWKGTILPLAKHIFQPNQTCECEEPECVVLLGEMGEGGCQDWIESVYNSYHEAYCISVCYGEVHTFLMYWEDWTNTGYTDMYWCPFQVECPDEWGSAFEVNLTQSYSDLPASPFEQGNTSYFLFTSATPWRLRATVTG